jgi:hypothetical protein
MVAAEPGPQPSPASTPSSVGTLASGNSSKRLGSAMQVRQLLLHKVHRDRTHMLNSSAHMLEKRYLLRGAQLCVLLTKVRAPRVSPSWILSAPGGVIALIDRIFDPESLLRDHPAKLAPRLRRHFRTLRQRWPDGLYRDKKASQGKLRSLPRGLWSVHDLSSRRRGLACGMLPEGSHGAN